MSVVTFEVTTYKVLTSSGRKGRVRGVDVEYQGLINCYGDGGKYTIYFMKEGSPLPDPVVSSTPTRGRGRVYVEYRYMPIYLDLLRNEKPMYAVVDSGNPDRCRIQTGLEDIGEDDD